jgi:hypothetical protein
LISRPLAALGAVLALSAQAADGLVTPPPRVYAFQVFLDGQPIGEHRFTVTADGADRRVASDARFAVKFLGFEAYRYRHHADEHWSGDCLVSLTASTDDDGKSTSVRLTKTGKVNEVVTRGGTTAMPGCLMSYAYWNPALLARTVLLNPQTGQADVVKIERLGTDRLDVHGQGTPAIDWRITSAEASIDVWLSAAGEWVGLDSLVAKGKHRLSYRLP